MYNLYKHNKSLTTKTNSIQFDSIQFVSKHQNMLQPSDEYNIIKIWIKFGI